MSFYTNCRYLCIFFVIVVISKQLNGQDTVRPKSFEVSGYIMTDLGYNFKQIDPDWFDVVKPSKLPSYKNQFGTNGNMYFSVRQTNINFKNYFQTPLGELKTHFAFEFFGTGSNLGQTAFRVTYAYGELGKWGAGQTFSPFMDIDVFPNSLEFWGPSGMVFLRNIQLRYMPVQGDNKLTIALEMPGATADLGKYADRIEIRNVKPRFQWPDLSAEYRKAFDWGYLELAGIVRHIAWEDQGNAPLDLSGNAIGWGISLSSNIHLGERTILRGQFVHGKAIQNYMNDAPVDIGIEPNAGNLIAPIKGVGLPINSVVAFIDHDWSSKLSSSAGYSLAQIENAQGSFDNAFRAGHYALANLLYTPVKPLTAGLELQFGKRENFRDGFSSDIVKLQFSVKYRFEQVFYNH